MGLNILGRTCFFYPSPHIYYTSSHPPTCHTSPSPLPTYILHIISPSHIPHITLTPPHIPHMTSPSHIPHIILISPTYYTSHHPTHHTSPSPLSNPHNVPHTHIFFNSYLHSPRLRQLSAKLNRVIKNGRKRGLKDPPSILAPDVARIIIFVCVLFPCMC